jgi:hypothetical protein
MESKVIPIYCDEIEAEELPKSDERIPTLAQEKHNPFIK